MDRRNIRNNFLLNLSYHLAPVNYWHDRLCWAERNLRNYNGTNARERYRLEREVRDAVYNLQSAVNRIARITSLPP